MIQTVLVTGANGFVGSHILEALALRDDLRLVAACRDGKRLPDNFQGEVRQGDLRDPAYVKSLVRGVDEIGRAHV
jgi:UDP-glucose 4-epimerase